MSGLPPAQVSDQLLGVIRDVVKEAVKEEMQASIPIVVEQLATKAFTVSSPFQTSTMPSSSRSLPDHLENSNTFRRWQLQFEGELPKRMYTGKKLRDHQGFSLCVVLRDEFGTVVNASSLTIKIVVLPGDYKAKDTDDSTGHFNENVLKKREGKPELLVGICEVELHKVAACIGDFKITDNSSWMRNGKFILGAIIEGCVPRGVTIREAISEAFEVKERRGEASQKKEIPSWNDEVWCLNHISRNGPIHRRLIKQGIQNVLQLLNLYEANQTFLKEEILKVSDSKMQEIIKHATSVYGTQTTTIGMGNDATILGYGNRTGLVAGHGPNSQMLSPTGIFGAGSYSSSDMQDLAHLAAFLVEPEMQPSFNYSSENRTLTPPFTEDIPMASLTAASSQAACDSGEFRTKFSRQWRAIQAVKRFISLRIVIASRPRKKQKI